MLLVLLVAWWLYRHALRYAREDMAEATAEGFALLAGLILASNPVLFSVGRAGTLNSMFVLLPTLPPPFAGASRWRRAVPSTPGAPGAIG